MKTSMRLVLFFVLSFTSLGSVQGSENLVYVKPISVGKPWPSAKIHGVLAFRGNPTRTYYGKGPLPDKPAILWRTSKPMCGSSSVGSKRTVWCGTGWTGQPVIFEKRRAYPGAPTEQELIFGAYDHKVHFLDAATGNPTRKAFATKDIIKGSVALDADGFPLLYFGSRDNYLRVLALDRKSPKQLYAVNGVDSKGMWNNDWDGNPLIINDHMLVGGENGLFYVIKLNRHFVEVDGKKQVQVKPKLLSKIPSHTRQLLRNIRDRMVSIESSVAVFENKVFFANSGGLVQGYDIDKLIAGASRSKAQVFEFWTGDDTDATLVIDEEGMIYAAMEKERRTNKGHARSGQLVKLNPNKPSDPVVWKVDFPKSKGKYGIWATPALYKDHLYAPAHTGHFWAIDRRSGDVTSKLKLSFHSWSSPVVVDDQMLVADCLGNFRRFDLADPSRPKLVWTFQLPSKACIESTPVVWQGRFYVGSRDGHFYAFGEERD